MRTLLTLAALAGIASGHALGAEPELRTEEEKTLYTMGVLGSRVFQVFYLSPAQLDLVKAGLTDAVTGRPLLVDVEAYKAKVEALATVREAEAARTRAAIESAVVEEYAQQKGAQRTATGLVIVPVREGTGAAPAADDLVRVAYEGRLADGSVFDPASARPGPLVVPLERSILCWREGLRRMKVGGRATLVCPAPLAYGDRGVPGKIPGGATLIFDIELVSIPGNMQTEPSGAEAAKPGPKPATPGPGK